MRSALFCAGLILWIVAAFVALSVLVDLHATIHGVRAHVEAQGACGKPTDASAIAA